MRGLALIGFASLSILASCQTTPEPELVQIQRQHESRGTWQQTRLTISNSRDAFALQIERDDDGSRALLQQANQHLQLPIKEAHRIEPVALCVDAKPQPQQTRLLLQVHYGGINNYYEYYGVDSHSAKLDYVGGYEIFATLEAGDLNAWLSCRAEQQAWRLEQSFAPCSCRQAKH